MFTILLKILSGLWAFPWKVLPHPPFPHSFLRYQLRDHLLLQVEFSAFSGLPHSLYSPIGTLPLWVHILNQVMNVLRVEMGSVLLQCLGHSKFSMFV